MNETNKKQLWINESREFEDRIHQIILACGPLSLKEKVSMLYLSIDYIFEHNPELMPLFTDEISIH